MVQFENTITNEQMTHVEFVQFVWQEAERQFNDTHEDESWDNLTKDEQLEIYCEQFEHQLNSNDWVMKM